MKKLIILSGYARAGKTTLLEILENKHGASSISTSVFLHTFAQNLAKEIFGFDLDTKQKKNSIELSGNLQLIDTNSSLRIKTPHKFSKSYTMRDYLIAIAERVIVKSFGRGVFGYLASRAIKESNSYFNVYEAFNYEEYRATIENLPKDIDVEVWILRRDSEEKGADTRELIENTEYKTTTIFNNGSLEQLEEKIIDSIR